MILFQRILFVMAIAIFAYLLARRIRWIRHNILLGRSLDRTDQPGRRWKIMLLVAFGQKKMFKKIIPALLHLFLYVGFIVINLEVIEFILDGLTGGHRLVARWLGGAGLLPVYTGVINIFESFAVAGIAASAVFLIRRNVIKVPRFVKPEMKGWPKLDANLILIFEIALMLAILTMNATDQILQLRGNAHYPETGKLFFSELLLVPLYRDLSGPVLVVIERIAWWFHILGIFGFALYVTYSKHLHIILAFPNTWYSKLEPMGKLPNMPEVTREVQMMLGLGAQDQPETASEDIPRLGAKDVRDLYWKNLMEAYTCTECGRCTSVCPANITGKNLSPRKIMMDTRDRVEEIGGGILKNGKEYDDGKSLLDDYITREELFACTTCNACTEACPVLIDPLSVIIQLRRYLNMEESGAPAEWNMMFSNIETSFSPWKFAPSDRFNWAKELMAENDEQ